MCIRDRPYKIDFVRYLSILSQYSANCSNERKVLVGYSAFGSRESFYADYVSYILGQGADEQESLSLIHIFRGGFVAEVGFSRTGVGVARDAPAAFRPRFVPAEQAAVEVIGVMSLAAVRGRFRSEPSALVVGVLRGLDVYKRQPLK